MFLKNTMLLKSDVHRTHKNEMVKTILTLKNEIQEKGPPGFDFKG